jgi:predicted GNAT family acetyltransferase
MYKKIEKDNKIFNSKEFLKDKYKFNLIFKNLSSPELELYSDEKSYIMCRGSKNLPTWIWTSDNFDEAKIVEIEELIKIFLTDNEKDKFTCKKELYDLLVDRNFAYLNNDDYFEMGFLICYQTKATKVCDGTLSKPTEGDIEILAKYWYDDNIEVNMSNPITWEQAMKDVENFISDDNFYVLRNSDNKIVCMANYSITGEQAKISHVYTPVEERKKGYAANLIYLMTNDILKRGLVPLLYTDYNYIPSNKAYINAGYEDKGILINFSCSRL